MSTNPYSTPHAGYEAPAPLGMDPGSVAKAEAIIKDAGQFWLAILMCLFCTGLGAIVIGPWYLTRLLQWNSLAKNHPQLVAPNSPPGSLEYRFRGAKVKLIIGLSFGLLIFLFVALVIALRIAVA